MVLVFFLGFAVLNFNNLTSASSSFSIDNESDWAEGSHSSTQTDGSGNLRLNIASTSTDWHFTHTGFSNGIIHDSSGSNLGTCGYGNYQYVFATEDQSVSIIDTTDPASMSQKAVISGVPAGVLGCAATASYLYLAASTADTLAIYNVSNPVSPTFAGSISGAGAPNYLDYASAVSVSGNYAYVASYIDNALTVINVSNPASPTFAGVISGAGNHLVNPKSVYISDSHAYVTDDNNDLSVIDISNPPTPTLAGYVHDVRIDGSFVKVSNSYAYTDSQGNSFCIIDVSNPALPVFALDKNIAGVTGWPVPSVDGSKMVFPSLDWTNNPLYAIDISDGDNPIQIATISGSGSPNYLDAPGGVYYNANNGSYFIINFIGLSITSFSLNSTETVTYSNSGTYTSKVFDAGGVSSLFSFTVDETLPSGTSSAYKMRSGNTSVPDGTWGGWTTISSEAIPTELNNKRYFQVDVYLTSDVTHVLTPLVNSISIDYSSVSATPTPTVASGNSSTWNFDNANDYIVSDLSKVKFSKGSVKIVPNGNADGGMYTYHDSSFGENLGYIYANDIEPSPDGNFYLGGTTCNNSNFDECYAFVAKLDANFNQVWYKRFWNATDPITYGPLYYDPPLGNNGDAGVEGVKLAPNGALIVTGVQVQISGPTAKFNALRINPDNGEVIWQKSGTQKPYPYASTWDEQTGPTFDSENNFYITYSAGCRLNYGAGPDVLSKYDINGNLIWTRTDDPKSGRTACTERPTSEDVWEAVTDSEGSVYVSSSYWEGPGWNMGYQVVKYDKNGNFKWRDLKNYAGDWDSPRGLAIDSSDNIYVPGNPPSGSPDCIVRKLDKNGEVLEDRLNIDPINNDLFGYCDGTIDKFDRFVLNAQENTAAADDEVERVAYFNSSDFVLEGESRTYRPTTISGDSLDGMTKTVFDRYGNSYILKPNFSDTRYGNALSALIIKGVNTYPDTRIATGTPLTITSKNGYQFSQPLSSFSVTYGEMDQSDVGFQLSNNGTDWYYLDGSTWKKTTGNDNSTVAQINTNISSFSTQIGTGTLYIKAFLLTDGTKEVDLASVTVQQSSAATISSSLLPDTGANRSFLNNLVFGCLIYSDCRYGYRLTQKE